MFSLLSLFYSFVENYIMPENLISDASRGLSVTFCVCDKGKSVTRKNSSLITLYQRRVQPLCVTDNPLSATRPANTRH
jgi:hypothetical protein